MFLRSSFEKEVLHVSVRTQGEFGLAVFGEYFAGEFPKRCSAAEMVYHYTVNL